LARRAVKNSTVWDHIFGSLFDMSLQPKVLVLLSGGLDSTLATKIMIDQGVDVVAAHFTTPFCQCDKCAVNRVGTVYNIPIHHCPMGPEFLDIVAHPPHGYGSQMNPCIDCRILMFRQAWALAQEVGAECLVTGEVVGQRPFSQRRKIMDYIERAAKVTGRVLRPLSAQHFPETILEQTGHIDRHQLLAFRGRQRHPQIHLAEQFGITDYPCPSGGCLLTEPAFARRLRDHLAHNGRITVTTIAYLKLGRHFRVASTKIIVGRNQTENQRLQALATRENIPYFQVDGYLGPTSIMLTEGDSEHENQIAADLTARYSDAPRDKDVLIRCFNMDTEYLSAHPITDDIVASFHIT